MQRIIMTLIAAFAVTLGFAQAPEGINYQAVARDGGGNLITNQQVDVRFSIRTGTANGSIAYQETHNPSVNDFGLFTLMIGQGSAQQGDFSTINWGATAHFLQVEMDAGNGFVDMGTTQLMSVPYALYAKEAGNAGPDYTAGAGIDISGNTITNTGDTNPNDDLTNTSPAGGDLSGTYPDPLVSGIQGREVTATAPASGQVLKWNGNAWAPANDVGGGNGDDWGSQVVNTDATLSGNGINGNELGIAQQGASNGQVLKWNGSTWAPAADNAGGGSSLWAEQGSDIYYTNGKVGIGTNTPGSALDVEGMVQLTKGAKSFQMGLNATDQLEIKPTGSPTSTITVDGNGNYVGLFGGSPLTANSQFDIHTKASNGSYGGMFINTKTADAKPFYGYATEGSAKAWSYFDGASGQMRLYNNGDRVAITNNGSVGIGTTNPTAPLHVIDEIRLSTATDIFDFFIGNDGKLEIQANSIDPSLVIDDDTKHISLFGRDQVTSNSAFDVYTPAGSGEYGGMFMNTSSTEGKPFYGYSTNGSAKAWTSFDGITGNWSLYNAGNRLTVTNQGKIGMGTSTPSAALHISDNQSGLFSQNTVLIESTNPNDSKTMLEFQVDQNANDYRHVLTINQGIVQTFSLDVDGSGRFSEVETWKQVSVPDKKKLYGNSLPLAYGHITSSGSAGNSKYGIGNVAKAGTGTYTITLLNPSEWSPAVMITPYDASGGEIANYSYDSNSKTITVVITESNGSKTDSDFSIVVFGFNEF